MSSNIVNCGFDPGGKKGVAPVTTVDCSAYPRPRPSAKEAEPDAAKDAAPATQPSIPIAKKKF